MNIYRTSNICINIYRASNICLDLDSKKSKIFALDAAYCTAQSPVLVEVAGSFVEVLRAGQEHKYLGAALPGGLQHRGGNMVAHRLQGAWSKFHAFRNALTNRHVDVRLRMIARLCSYTVCLIQPLHFSTQDDGFWKTRSRSAKDALTHR